MLQTKRCPFNSLNWNNSSNNSYPLLSTCCVSNIVKLLLVFIFNHLIHIPPLLSQFYKRGNQGTEFKKPTWGYAAVSVRVTTLDPDHMVPATSLLTTILHGLLNHGLARKGFIYFLRRFPFSGEIINKGQILLFIYFINIITYVCTYIPAVYSVSIFH